MRGCPVAGDNQSLVPHEKHHLRYRSIRSLSFGPCYQLVAVLLADLSGDVARNDGVAIWIFSKDLQVSDDLQRCPLPKRCREPARCYFTL
jgi:hypothetical protein